jgi:probable biosynthetic protein (TIGR04098 family)
MPHTIAGALGEVALLARSQDLHWRTLGEASGCPASRLADAAGRDVYASVYFVDVAADAAHGLASFGPDDQTELVGALGRYGASMLDGSHALYGAGVLPDVLPAVLPPPPVHVRMAFVLVAMGGGNDDLRVAAPANARLDAIAPLGAEPDAYRLSRAARAAGGFAPPGGVTPLWSGAHCATLPINPDRDLNGVGLLYFANYVAFLDAAERQALSAAGFSAAQLDGRVTVRRRIAYYGNALSHDALRIETEAQRADGDAGRLHIAARVHRVSDDRLIAVASAERRLRDAAARCGPARG